MSKSSIVLRAFVSSCDDSGKVAKCIIDPFPFPCFFAIVHKRLLWKPTPLSWPLGGQANVRKEDLCVYMN
jgi:hypothetical protein